MSRSNPTVGTPHPSSRWIEFKGKEGHFQWYDKEAEKNILVKLPFTFIVLDRTATVRGYNKKLQAGFYSNEVRDTRSEPFVVKNFKSGVVATGMWTDIKDSVTVKGGKFCTNVYIAFKDSAKSPLQLGCIQMQGCALGPWFDFEKENRKAMFEKAVVVKKVVDGETDGDIEFKVPVFELADVTEKTNAEAMKLDAVLQAFFAEYFQRNKLEQAHPSERPQEDPVNDGDQDPEDKGKGGKKGKAKKDDDNDVPPVDDDNDVPF